jgi:hypothetical protein
MWPEFEPIAPTLAYDNTMLGDRTELLDPTVTVGSAKRGSAS